MKDMLRFFNQLAAAIHAADPKALVTVGAWSQWTIADGASAVGGALARANADQQQRVLAAEPPAAATPATNARNYYSDACLVEAGGLAGGTLDFAQVSFHRLLN